MQECPHCGWQSWQSGESHQCKVLHPELRERVVIEIRHEIRVTPIPVALILVVAP